MIFLTKLKPSIMAKNRINRELFRSQVIRDNHLGVFYVQLNVHHLCYTVLEGKERVMYSVQHGGAWK